MKKIIVCWMLIIVSSALNAESQTIYWARTDFPPFFILSGEFADRGIADQMIDRYIDDLPQYKHVRVEASIERVLREMATGHTMCHAFLLKSAEREAFVEFSRSNLKLFANGIVINKKQRSRFDPFINARGAVDFLRLINEGQLRIKLHQGRSYSPLIDSIIADAKATESSGLIFQRGMSRAKSTIQELNEGFLDGWIARPEEAYYLASELGLEQSIEFLPIDGQSEFSSAYVGCGGGEWNKALMEHLNSVISEVTSDGSFMHSYQRWLLPAMSARYQKVFGQH